METNPLAIDVPVRFMLSRCPVEPSKTTRPILFAVLIVTVLVPSIAIRPVNSTSAAVKGSGGTKKSSVLIVVPAGVVNVIRPDVALEGTVVARLVTVAESIEAFARLNFTLLLAGIGSKFVPSMVTAVSAVPTKGVNDVMVGAPESLVTSKLALLVTEPAGVVTEIVPVMAPEGTLVTISVEEADATLAVTPLNLTVFSLGVELKPVP